VRACRVPRTSAAYPSSVDAIEPGPNGELRVGRIRVRLTQTGPVDAACPGPVLRALVKAWLERPLEGHLDGAAALPPQDHGPREGDP
jgi:hypothetical protein